MKFFISVSSKLLFLIVTILLMISAGYSWHSLSRLSAEFQQHQVETLKQGKQQLTQHLGQLNSQLTVWLESFSDINQLQDKGDFHAFSQSLAKQYDGLQMHFNINDIWLIQTGNALFKTSPINKMVHENTEQVLKTQAPVEHIYCQDVCLQVISIPLLNFDGEIGVITLTSSLVDILFSLNSVLKRDVAVLKIPKLGIFYQFIIIIFNT